MSTWSGRRPVHLPSVLLAVVLAGVAAGDGLRLVHTRTSAAPAFDAWFEATVNALTFSTVGALVARHRPGNAVGWLFVGVGGASAVQLLTMVVLLVSLPMTMLLFPDGRLVSPRWRPVLWLDLASGALLLTGLGLAPGALDNTAGIDNPFAVLPLGAAQQVANAAAVGLLSSVVAAMASLAVRWHRCGPDGRQQLKWVVFAGVIGTSSILLVTAVLPGWVTGWFGSLLWALGVGVIPAAAGVSLLRYRLYDIDRPRYDAARTVEAFSARLRVQVDLDSVQTDLLAVVRRSLEPTSTTLWLRQTGPDAR